MQKGEGTPTQGCQLKLKKIPLKTPDFSQKSQKDFRLKIP
jgi:hypothetical protein